MKYDFKIKPVRLFAEMMDRAASELDPTTWDASQSTKLEDLGIAVEELDDAAFRDQPEVIVEKAVAVAIAAIMIATKAGR